MYFIMKPSNSFVLFDVSIGARIYVLKGMAEIEMLYLNSKESFENNKQFLKLRMEQEDTLQTVGKGSESLGPDTCKD